MHAQTRVSTAYPMFTLQARRGDEEKERVSRFGITGSERTVNICLARNCSNYSPARERAADFLTAFLFIISRLCDVNRSLATHTLNESCKSLRKVQDFNSFLCRNKRLKHCRVCNRRTRDLSCLLVWTAVNKLRPPNNEEDNR